MIKEICVIGHPSYYGGADTELYSQIKCWHKMGIKIYICHTGVLSEKLKNQMRLEELYGCTYITPRHWHLVKHMHCISFCNGEFLKHIDKIKKYAKTTTFVNCMTWNFPKEIQAQYNGLIDFHLYQTKHAYDKISKKLKHLGTYRPLFFTPYFDAQEFPYYSNRPKDKFRFGRISRSDFAKYSKDQFIIYDSIESPNQKSGVILGMDDRIKRYLKIPSNYITMKQRDNIKSEFYKNYIQLLKPGSVSQQDFYKFCDIMILSTNTFENLPRIGFEAMASGTILVVDNRGGWQLEIDHNKTGFLCDTTNDFITYSTLLASNHELKEEIRGLSRLKLEQQWNIEQSMKSWELVFNEIEKIN